MAKTSEITSFLNQTLKPELFRDGSFNGPQIMGTDVAVKRVALAVDAGLSVIKEAVERNAQMLIVHHGLLWGDQMPVTGIYGQKVKLLLENNCTLYASHLPLDGHMQYGNAVELAKFFGFKKIQPCFEYSGMPIGAWAENSEARPIADFVARSREMIGAIEPLVLQFGPTKIKSVGFATGSGSFAIAEAAARKLDLLISGESKQSAYHDAKELGLNVIFAGHYATETFGVQAIGRLLKKKYNVVTDFIDQPTGI